MFRDSVTNLTAAGLIVAVRCCNFSSDISLSLLNWLMSGQMSTSDGFSRLHTAQKWVAAAHSLQRLSSIRIDSRLMCSWYCHVHMCPKSLQILIYSLKHRKNLLQIFVCVCVYVILILYAHAMYLCKSNIQKRMDFRTKVKRSSELFAIVFFRVYNMDVFLWTNPFHIENGCLYRPYHS